jgi:hypothetical protein
MSSEGSTMMNLAETEADLDALLAPVGGGTVAAGQRALRTRDGSIQLDFVQHADGSVRYEQPDATPPSDDIAIQRVRFSDLEGNAIYEKLAELDKKRTPNQGLRALDEHGRLRPAEGTYEGRTLLVVHGTFSNAEIIIDAIRGKDEAFLSSLPYDNILSFDYATMSSQAIASAMELAILMRAHVPGPVDVISHSQGGLVTRYWLELLDRERLEHTRSVFVAGTLGGTSLAAPAALRRALDLLTNVAWALRKGSDVVGGAIPFFSFISGLFAVLEKGIGLLAKAPVIDAGVAVVPGFNGMSRGRTNREIDALRRSIREAPPGYFAITGDFEPKSHGWRFWKTLISRAKDGAADLLFRGPNDLVVDTSAQTELSDLCAIEGAGRVHAYAAGELEVHHTNYFEQQATLDFLSRCLKRP